MKHKGVKRQTPRSVANLVTNLAHLSVKDNRKRLSLIDDLLDKCTYYNNNTTNCSQLLDEHKVINGLVDDIMAIEKEMSVQLPTRSDDNWSAFKKWMSDNGIDMSKVDIKWWDDRQGYGLMATQDIKESDVFLVIPKSVTMSSETALKSDPNLVAFMAKDPILQHMPNIVVALHLIDEYCKSDSFWKPYLQCLPSDYESALYLTDKDVNQLKGSQVLEEVVKLKRSIARQYAYFTRQMCVNDKAVKLGFKNFFTYELYRWAVSTVMTRQNAIPSCDGQSTITALIPLWDMCNHKHGKFSADYDDKTGSSVCLAMNDFMAGEQIFIHYGTRSNGEFFVHNGFVYNDNCNDFVPLRLGISRNDPLFQDKYDLCKKLGLNVSGVYRLRNKSQPIDQNLLAFLRVFHFNQGDIDNYRSTDACTQKGNEKCIEKCEQKYIQNPNENSNKCTQNCDLKCIENSGENSINNCNNITDIYSYDCKSLAHLNDKMQQFLSTRSALLLNAYPKPEPQIVYNKPYVDQLIKSEMKILDSYVH